MACTSSELPSWGQLHLAMPKTAFCVVIGSKSLPNISTTMQFQHMTLLTTIPLLSHVRDSISSTVVTALRQTSTTLEPKADTSSADRQLR